MTLSTFEAIIAALEEAKIRYLVAGGLAVNAHGYLRLTQDIDIVIQLEAANVIAAFAAFSKLGYRPAVPVTADQFADAAQRSRWIAEKGMMVLNFFSDTHREMSLDIFVTEPFDFKAEYREALVAELSPGVPARFVSIPTLIKMKQLAGRPRDLDDIHHLGWILEEQKRK